MSRGSVTYAFDKGQEDDELKGNKLKERLVGGQILLEVAIDLEDRHEGGSERQVAEEPEPELSVVQGTLKLAVDASGLGDGGGNGDEEGNRDELPDHEVLNSVPVEAINLDIGLLLVGSDVLVLEEHVTGSRVWGDVLEEEEEEGAESHGLEEVLPRLDVDVGCGPGQADPGKAAVDRHEQSNSHNLDLLGGLCHPCGVQLAVDHDDDQGKGCRCAGDEHVELVEAQAPGDVFGFILCERLDRTRVRARVARTAASAKETHGGGL